MTCAKVVVTATLLTLDNEVFIGRNDVPNPQKECPRVDGEGYEKCKSICKQERHAEIDAIEKCRAAGCNPRYGSISVDYHYVCPWCQAELDKLGIRYIATPKRKE